MIKSLHCAVFAGVKALLHAGAHVDHTLINLAKSRGSQGILVG